MNKRRQRTEQLRQAEQVKAFYEAQKEARLENLRMWRDYEQSMLYFEGGASGKGWPRVL